MYRYIWTLLFFYLSVSIYSRTREGILGRDARQARIRQKTNPNWEQIKSNLNSEMDKDDRMKQIS